MSKAQHWAHIEESSFILGMRFLFWLYRCLGRWPFRLALYPVIVYYWLSKRQARQASINYLRRFARYHQQKPPGPFASLQHLLSFGEGMLDKLLVWKQGIPAQNIEFEGRSVAESAIASGRGGVIITSHLGNLELSNLISKQTHSAAISILVHTKHAASFNRFLTKLNPNSQVNLIQVTDITPATTIQLAEQIAAGGFVVIAGDRIPVSQGAPVVMAPFLGEPAPFPVGPWILANSLRCPVYLLWNVKIGERYHLRFTHFRDEIHLPRATRQQATQALITEFALHLEEACRLSPMQWFNFFDFWALPPNMQHKIWN